MKTSISEHGILGSGLIFLPEYEYEAILCMEVLTGYIRQEGFDLVSYQDMNINTPLPHTAATGFSHIAKVVVGAGEAQPDFGQKLELVFRKAADKIHHSTLKHRGEFSVGTVATKLLGKAG